MTGVSIYTNLETVKEAEIYPHEQSQHSKTPLLVFELPENCHHDAEYAVPS